MNILEAWSLSTTTHHSSPADHPRAVGMGLGGGVGGGGSGCRQRGALQWSEWKEVSLLDCSCPHYFPSLEAHPGFLETVAR